MLALVRKHFEGDIRQQVLENLVPKFLEKELEKQDLRIVGTPDISDVHFHRGEPLRFKAEFEVFPQIELKEYQNLEVPYKDPQVTDEDVAKRLEEIRDQKADYSNVDPRPIADGDHAVISIESPTGAEASRKTGRDDVARGRREDTLPAFTENLRGMSPARKRISTSLIRRITGSRSSPERTIRFHVVVKGLRKKELPEVNDEFAQDLGDFRTVDELREALRKTMLAQRQNEAQQEAKNKLVENSLTCTTSLFRRPLSTGRCVTAWSRLCTRWLPRASTAARSSSTGRSRSHPKRDKALGEVSLAAAFTPRRARNYRRHPRRGG